MVEITDEMVERAYRHAETMSWDPWVADTRRRQIRLMLEAAMNSHSEPEITVTEEMEHVGEMQYRLYTGNKGDGGAAKIYRAMRALEPPQSAQMCDHADSKSTIYGYMMCHKCGHGFPNRRKVESLFTDLEHIYFCSRGWQKNRRRK